MLRSFNLRLMSFRFVLTAAPRARRPLDKVTFADSSTKINRIDFFNSLRHDFFTVILTRIESLQTAKLVPFIMFEQLMFEMSVDH